MINPVFRREIQTTYRSFKLLIIVMVYVLVLTGIAALFTLSIANSKYYGGYTPASFVTFNQVLLIFQTIFIVLLVIVFSSGAISSERESQTFDLMIMSKMKTSSIVFGKLFSSVSYAVLLVVASLPVFMIASFYGATDFLSVLMLDFYLISFVFFAGSVTIFFSCIFKKQAIVVLISLIILGIIVFLPAGFVVFRSIFGFSNYYMSPPTDVKIAIPPISTMQIILTMPFINNTVTSVLNIFDIQTGSETVVSLFRAITDDDRILEVLFQIPFWVVNFVSNIIFGSLIVFISGRAITPIKRSKRYK